MERETFHLLIRIKPDVPNEPRLQVKGAIEAFIMERGGQQVDADLFVFYEAFNRHGLFWPEITKILGEIAYAVLIRDVGFGASCLPNSLEHAPNEHRKNLEMVCAYYRVSLRSLF